MRVTDLAYTAGIIDGEGTIIIRRTSMWSNERWKKRGFGLAVQVGISDRELCDWLRELWGGSVYTYKDKRSEYWKAISRWFISANQALALLEAILPYLRLKRTQAEVGIAFQQAKKKRGSRHRKEGEIEAEIKSYWFIRKLKDRGLPNEKIQAIRREELAST